MSWKRRLYGAAGSLLYRSGAHRLLLRNRAAVVVFHRIDDRYPDNWITLSTSVFQAHCDFLARHFRVVPLGRLVEMLGTGEDLSRCLAITFDDGYRDNYLVAAPYLESLGLPACFFVTTGFIGSEVVPWWDERQSIRSEWMTWAEVRDLRRRGFEIGAHTVSHVDLGQTAGEEARREIVGSKEELERQLEAPVTLFCYPYGRANQMTDANRAVVRVAGFVCCASSHGGTIRPGMDPFSLLRVPATNWHVSAGHLGFDLLFP